MNSEFEQLIKQFSVGTLDKGRFVASFNQFVRENPDLTQSDLVKAVKRAKSDDHLNNTEASFLIDSIKTTIGSSTTNLDHTIVPTEILDRDEETIVYSHTRRNQSSNLSESSSLSNVDESAYDLDDEPENILDIGSIIKERFVLVELLGRGGMGVVYKARDLVKVQAQDSNPYVAVKVLTEAFKKHSSSFIALQREASKAQRLAHPNIATVYDFDHDNGSVYMTMELMIGQNLQKLIKEMPKDGLPKEIALNYICQLAEGLSYAHKRQLIHCDLKPANIFLTEDGTIKLLDFGITRAIKRDNDVDDTTIFDPKVLKALTPAYASIEMFSGADPDPRDDIYALGCVAHELLTGTHPYKKVPAHKAKELNLKVPSIKKLTRRENKALNDLIALDRKKRTPSIDVFFANLKTTKSYIKELLIGASAIILIGGGFLLKPILNQQSEDQELLMIQNIQNGDQAALITLLDELPNMDFNTRISLSGILRKEIISHYQLQINDAIDANKQKYDFPEAFKLLNKVKQLYPDSASLAAAHKSLKSNRDRLVAALEKRHKIIQSDNGDTSRILTILLEADPYHKLLRKDK